MTMHTGCEERTVPGAFARRDGDKKESHKKRDAQPEQVPALVGSLPELLPVYIWQGVFVS